MLYNKNKTDELDIKLFESPTSEYKGVPFWSWNCELKEDRLLRQIDYLKAMGFGAFNMHSRSGMTTKYLGKEFMELVKKCTVKAKDTDMFAWIYDEDRWPSGYGGGFVTKNPEYRQRILKITKTPDVNTNDFDDAIKNGKNIILAAYDVRLSEDGCLDTYKRIGKDEAARNEKWYACFETAPASTWFNNYTYVDTLSKKAMKAFVDLVISSYKAAVGEHLGNTIPALFTDEPQYAENKQFGDVFSDEYAKIAWTADFADSFKEKFGFDILDRIPEYFWDIKENEPSEIKYLVNRHTTDLFTGAFAEQYSKACEESGIYLSGHMMAEDNLESQLGYIGDAMQSYPYFGIPGVDILCDGVKLVTVKQAQSSARQYGKEGLMSEIYGVTDWGYDFRDHKFGGDWQAALGVTVRVHHLSWVSMKGMAKRDYPASINYQSAWYDKYSYIEDHFSRLNTAMTRGRDIVRIGVIHTAESYWAKCGPDLTSGDYKKAMENNLENITDILLKNQLDFDFICEKTIPQTGRGKKIGEMEYDVIILPSCVCLRASTVEFLESFRECGGRVIFIGDCPEYTDGRKSDKAKNIYKLSEKAANDELSICHALAHVREVELVAKTGKRDNNYIYRYTQDKKCRWLFVARCVKPACYTNSIKNAGEIIVKGEYTPSIYDTITGKVYKTDYKIKGGKTHIPYSMYMSDSMLIRLDEKTQEAAPCKTTRELICEKPCLDFADYSLSEPNVLVLDMAKWCTDGGEIYDKEEIRRIDVQARLKAGLAPKDGHAVQPWTITEAAPVHTVTLKFEFESEIEYKGAYLALEDAEKAKITFNGVPVKNDILSYYVDEDISKILLGDIMCGKNELEITLPFGDRTDIENVYILGDFGVKTAGCKAWIAKKEKRLAFSDITGQGLPFYGAKVCYRLKINTTGGNTVGVAAPDYSGAYVSVTLDGKDERMIAFDPCEAIFENVPEGEHEVEITCCLTRKNTFGAHHNNDTTSKWYGPDMWEKKDDKYSYTYKLAKEGILSEPKIRIYK